MRLSTLGRLGLAFVWCALLSLQPQLRSAPPGETAGDHKPQIPELKVETYTLPNGLTVTLHEDHKTPLVAVHLWYKVGSKDEQTGRTGFAHLFEHMMFQGSKNHDTRILRAAWSSSARSSTAPPAPTARSITRQSPATLSSWLSGSKPIGWVS